MAARLLASSTQTPTPPSRARLPRYRRVDGFPSITIGLPRQRILSALLRFHYLTAPQLARYGFSQGSITYVRSQLQGLPEAAPGTGEGSTASPATDTMPAPART